MNWGVFSIVVFAAVLLVLLNRQYLKKKHVATFNEDVDVDDFLPSEVIEHKYQEAKSEFALLQQWAQLGVVRWVYSELPVYSSRLFELERNGKQRGKPFADLQKDDPNQGYTRGYLYGLNRRDWIVEIRTFHTSGSYDVTYIQREANFRLIYNFEGENRELQSFERTVWDDEKIRLWEQRDRFGLYHERYHYPNAQAIEIDTARAEQEYGMLKPTQAEDSYSIQLDEHGAFLSMQVEK